MKASHWRVWLPGGDERYVATFPPREPEEVRQDYPKALKIEAMERAPWMEASGRVGGRTIYDPL